MDTEIENFLELIPKNGVILDVGGCWGWHWRFIDELRPDVTVVIMDFIRENLTHAKKLLDGELAYQVILVHADAMKLPFDDDSFDGIWSVQTYQHIPNLEAAFSEASRVLKINLPFYIYGLHRTPMIELLFFLCNKKYHISGVVENSYILNRMSDEQKTIGETIFNSSAKESYSECLFHPELRTRFTGKDKSVWGYLDKFLAGFFIAKYIARQRAFKFINSKSYTPLDD
tara:strand:- start:1467 stop:2153 length:687 start_codon:yes stop_codon:yes gene_type:complete